MQKYNRYFLALVSLLLLFPARLRAETAVEAWLQRYNGPAGINPDYARAMAMDGGDNVIVTGYSYNGTNNDYATIKYSSAGLPLWTNRYNGPGNKADQATAVAVDSNDNVIVTGHSYNGTYTDIVTIQYSSAGLPLWTNRYNGPGNREDQAAAVAVDGSNRVIVTGYSHNGANNDYVTIQYSSAGVPLWTNRYNGPGNKADQATAVAVDSDDNVIVAGYSHNGANSDYLTIQYSSAGVPLWTNRYNGPANSDDYATAVAVDSSNHVIVTGESNNGGIDFDYVTIKFTAAGVSLWTNRYDGPGTGGDYAYALAVDHDDNVLVTGESDNGTNSDYLTIRYSGAGVPLWTNRYNGAGDVSDYANALAVDASNNVIVTGYSGKELDSDCATIKYTAAGVPLWTNLYSGSAEGDDQGSALAVDGDNAVIVVGNSYGSASGHDYLTIKYGFLPEITAQPSSRTNNTGTTATFTVTAAGSAPLRHQWIKNETNRLADGDGISGATSSTLTLTGVQLPDAGDYAVVVTNSLGSVTSLVAVLTVVDTTPPSITCPGDTTVAADTGVCFATGVSLGDPTASDNSGSVTVTNNATAQFPMGTNVVTWTATDPSDNTQSCTQLVIVVDTQPPEITLLGDNPLTHECHATLLDPGATAVDNCAGSLGVTTDNPVDPNTPGTYVITYVATDPDGNAATNTRTVQVVDTTPPAITCPGDVIINADAGQCHASGVILGIPVVDDNCGVASVTNDLPGQLPVGTNVVTWTANDPSDNTQSCTQLVIVVDTQPPEITLLGDNPLTHECHTILLDPGATAVDNCAGSLGVTTNNPVDSNTPGTYVITYVATDPGGNAATNTRTVQVVDTTPPAITCPGDVIINADAGQCHASGVILGVPATDDTCGVASVTNDLPGQLPVGTNLVTWTAIDGAGNTNTCQQTVIVRDTKAPVITEPPQSRTNVTGSEATFSVSASACTPPGYQWHFGPNPLVGETNFTLTITDVHMIHAGSYSVVITSAGGSVTSELATLTVMDSENNPPTVTILSPASNGSHVTNQIVVTGKATDGVRVDQVWLSVNGGGYGLIAAPLAKSAYWTNRITMVPGTNTVFVKSVDSSGNESLVASRKFFLQLPKPLTVLTNGNGRLQPNLHGLDLFVGRSYSMTAEPGSDWLFTNWTASVDGGPTNVVFTSANYTFLMQTNLTLVANFVPNRFLGAAGSYYGLFWDTNRGVAHGSGGFFKLKVKAPSSKLPTFSGKLTVEGQSHGFSGTLDLGGNGNTLKPVLRKSKSPLQVRVQLPLDGSETVSGSVSNLDGSWVSELGGNRAVFNFTNNPATNYRGSYTLVLPASGVPGGDGYAVVKVADNGAVKVTGKLGDAETFKPLATVLSKDGDWAFYAPAYPWTNGVATNVLKQYAGEILGWLSISNDAARHVVGDLVWIKTGWTNGFYDAGFTNEVTVAGGGYTPDANRLVTLTNGVVIVSGGNLPADCTNSFVLNGGNKFVVTNTPYGQLPGTNKDKKVTASYKTGMIKVTFMNPGDTNVMTTATGVVLQHGAVGGGVFKGLTNQTGSLRLQGD